MTLSPVFRSDEAVEAFREAGVWSRLAPAARGQAEAIAAVRRDLPNVLDAQYIDAHALPTEGPQDASPIEFFQEFFFLILFRSVLQTVGVSAPGLALCSELNFCIKGTITAADNLFDDQDKTLLPLRAGDGVRFKSILQLLVFERLASRVLARGVRSGTISTSAADRFQKELLSRMAAIGSLEGSEERGVSGVLEPESMIEHVHRLRGGALFELAFIAPRLLEQSVDEDLLSRAQRGISKLGTAFQIVDDLTDFEFDLARGSHNLLISQITHRGTPEERLHLRTLANHAADDRDLVSQLFAESGRAVVERGAREAREALEELQSLGYWFPPALGGQLVRVIVGMEGLVRMRSL